MAQRVDPSDIGDVKLVGSLLLAENADCRHLETYTKAVFAVVVVSLAICNSCGLSSTMNERT